MKKKNFVILFLSVLLLLGLTACGKKTLEDVIVGKWQDSDGNIIGFNEDDTIELSGEKIGYYNVTKNHLELYAFHSNSTATMDAELNGDDCFFGYGVTKNNNGEIVEEDEETFTRLGSSINNSDTNIDISSNTESTNFSETEDLSLKNIIIGHWRTDNGPGREEFLYDFMENGRFNYNGVDAGFYSITEDTLEYTIDVEEPTVIVTWKIEVQSVNELAIVSETYSDDGKITIDNNPRCRLVRRD